MWERRNLKEKAKSRLSVNYWKMVLVGVIIAIIAGNGFSGSSGSGATVKIPGDQIQIFEDENWDDEYDMTIDDITDETATIFDRIEYELDKLSGPQIAGIIAVAVIILIVVAIIIALIIIVLKALIFNPIQVGCRRFFVKNLNESANIKEICYSFDNGYKNAVATMFFRDLFTFLWSLLFIIPGIVKGYEYRMVPYILAENPEMSRKDVFMASRDMMMGNKWNAFVLDISFIGWSILNVCTFGILGVFYLNPYYNQTCAALYETLRNQDSMTAY